MTIELAIVGPPKSGKTTLAGDGEGVRHTDDLIELGWSEASEKASYWFDEPDVRVVEGVAVLRAARKWMRRNPEGRPFHRLVYLSRPRVPLTRGQRSMGAAIQNMLIDLGTELLRRGVHIDEDPEEADESSPGLGLRKQRRSEGVTAAQMSRLTRSAERQLNRAFLRMLERIRGEAAVGRIAPLLEQGRVEDALGTFSKTYEHFASEWIELYVATAESISAQLERGLGGLVAFDRVNERAVEAMRGSRLRLVSGLSEAQRGAVREALLEGIRTGANPRGQARAFRASIGLTARQEQFVQNFRAELETGSARALGRRLRDRRFDPTVVRAIEGEALEAATVDKMVARYRERWVKYRAEVIARTESLRAVHEGAEEAYQQAIDSGDLDPQELVRVWNTAADARVRDSHGSMGGQQRPIGQPFTSGDGAILRYPGDPSASAAETAQCRCVLSTRFVRSETLELEQAVLGPF